jgi:hypothetical protein
MKKLTLIAFALGLVIVGCAPTSSTVQKPNQGTSPTSGSNTTQPDAKADSPSTDTVPAELKHDAYMLNGLDMGRPLSYNFTRVTGDSPEPGTQTNKLIKVANGEAEFEVSRTGSLAAMGDKDTEVVKPDGLYLTSTAMGTLKSTVKMMPAKVVPGTTWEYAYQITKTDGTVWSFKGKARAERNEKVIVGGKEFDALLVTDTQELEVNGTKRAASSKTWYSRGLGIVKLKLQSKDQKNNLVDMLVEINEKGDQ